MNKRNPLLRILFSVALVAVVFFIYQQRRGGFGSKAPFVTNTPSGEGGNRFAWIPSYPGAQISDIHSRVTHGELNYGFEFRSQDEFRKVAAFYQEGLRTAGFTVQSKEKGGIELDLHGESPDRTRIIDIVTEQLGDKGPNVTGVTVAAQQK